MANAVVTGPVATGRDAPQAFDPPPFRARSGVPHRGRDGSIVLGYSNKQHDGFLGHSYLGAWVNLGAATDTSDLKNDYGPVRLTVAGETIDTGDVHVGSLIGDHSKTAIHTRLNTGTVVGVCCNVLGPNFRRRRSPASLGVERGSGASIASTRRSRSPASWCNGAASSWAPRPRRCCAPSIGRVRWLGRTSSAPRDVTVEP
jgi:hypothetical protein